MGVLSKIYYAKVAEFNERLREMTDERVVYVSDLVSCSHKRVMRIRYPFIGLKFEPQLVLGDLVHRGIESLVLEGEEGWRAEVSIEEHVEVDGIVYRLLGRADLVKFADDGSVEEVVEVKTVRQLQPPAPYEHHVLQVRIYAKLLGARRASLLYVSPDRLVEYDVEVVDVDVLGLLRDTVYDRARPRYEWECRYCPFRKFCPYARSGEETRRVSH